MKCFANRKIIAISNEITGYILAKEAGLPVPEKCALMALPQEIKMNLNRGLAKSALSWICYDDGRREHT